MKRYWPALVGTVLFTLTGAGIEFTTLNSLIDQGQTHWKFGPQGYYDLTVWSRTIGYGILAALFLAFSLTMIRFSKRMSWYLVLLMSICLGAVWGLKEAHSHGESLQLGSSVP